MSLVILKRKYVGRYNIWTLKYSSGLLTEALFGYLRYFFNRYSKTSLHYALDKHIHIDYLREWTLINIKHKLL